jgi:FdhD protein
MDDELSGPSGWPTTLRRVQRVSEEGREEQEIEVVLEEPLALHINGKQVAVMMRLPGQEKELAAGFCVSEGLVERFTDVLMIHHCGRGLPAPGEAEENSGESRHRVEVLARAEALRPEARMEVVRLIRAGCGAVDVERTTSSLAVLPDGPTVDAACLLGLDKAMRAAQRVHEHAGGVHAAALFDTKGALVILCEDVGRHNAVDKALGHCLLHGIPVRDKVLVCSGRLSYEMVTKAVRVGLAILVSVSAPTALAVQFAERFNITLVGYLRGRHMTLYTHPERIT